MDVSTSLVFLVFAEYRGWPWKFSGNIDHLEIKVQIIVSFSVSVEN